jgi:predicted DCC family thiol-disulfide oxidoreductase YuxK
MEDKPLLLFDGVCNLCNRSVQFVIRHDRGKVFRFASLQGTAAARALEPFGGGGATPGSVLLIYGGRLYTRSEAVLKTIQLLGGAWRLAGVFRVLPRPLRDRLYDWVARNRYRWFGKRDACMVPEPGLRDRFLDGGA